MYNAHGDVVTLLSDGEVAATYYYDSFGNILEQTGDVDNSILYAGYQYDEETGLYYINARMYDPVTARFLQADTYAGSIDDPLSLNLYTYCLNNPHKYVDPSGHFAITAAAVLLAVRIGISVFSGVMGAKAEYDRQVAEGDNYTNWGSILFVGAANAGVSFLTFGIGQGAAVAGVGAKSVLKHVGKAVVRDAAIGALTDAGIETARQLVTGTKIANLEYDRIAEAGVFGGITGGASTLAGAGLEGLMKTRVAQSAMKKVNLAASKGANAIKNGFAKVATKNGKTVGMEAVTGLKEPGFKMDLQFFASDEAYQSGSKSVAKSNQGQGFSAKGYNPNPGERTFEGYVKQTSDPEISLYTKSSGFNNNSKGIGGQFKRFGANEHYGLSPHVHQPVRNTPPNGMVFGRTGKDVGIDVFSPNRKDIKQLYEYLYNGKYHE